MRLISSSTPELYAHGFARVHDDRSCELLALTPDPYGNRLRKVRERFPATAPEDIHAGVHKVSVYERDPTVLWRAGDFTYDSVIIARYVLGDDGVARVVGMSDHDGRPKHREVRMVEQHGSAVVVTTVDVTADRPKDAPLLDELREWFSTHGYLKEGTEALADAAPGQEMLVCRTTKGSTMFQTTWGWRSAFERFVDELREQGGP